MENDCYSSYWVTAGLCIIEQQAELAGVIITSSAATKTVVSLYDGVNSNGKLLGTYRVAADSTISVIFYENIILNYGLYVDVDANITGVQVFYKPIKRQE